MSNIIDDFDKKLGERLKLEREGRGWSLTELAAKAQVSRAMINNIERGVTSPTASLLGRLSGALGLTMSTLLARTEALHSGRLLRESEQPRWQDPKSGYVRQHVAPAPGSDLPVEVIRVEMPAGAQVTFPAASYVFIRQIIWVIRGALVVTEGNQTHRLDPGDSLEFGAPEDCDFRNEGLAACVYVVVVLRTPAR